jgi:peroxiredoxin
MNKIFLAALVLISSQLSAQQKFTLEGNTAKLKNDTLNKVFINYRVGGEWKNDSAVVTGNTYTFSGQIEEPSLAYLRVTYKRAVPQKINQKRDVVAVYLMPAKVVVNHVDSFSNVKVKGSKAHESYTALNNKMKSFNTEMEGLSNEYRALAAKKDEQGMKAIEAKFDEIELRQKEVYKSEFIANPGSPIATYVLDRYAGYDINADDVDPLFAMLPATAKASPSGKTLSDKLALARITGIGKSAPEFVQNDTLGNPVALSSFRGKYLLVDFWASWCGPCRKENPNVVKAFEKYKEKGFHILGVSLDQPNAKDKWMKAIHDDQLTWSHVSDLQYWKNAVAVQYGVQAIPQNYLIDPAGKIVAKNLRGEDLDKKLGELIK